MGRLDRIKAAQEASKGKSFSPLDLNEGNVQAIFNRCLAKESTPIEKETSSILFSRTMGFSGKDVRIIDFDKEILLTNKKNIEYLYGQLKVVHENSAAPVKIPLADMISLYNGTFWTNDSDLLIKLGYLGVPVEIGLINPVLAKDRSTVIRKDIKPTLSPKDPNFPAWWEEHKGEWEE